MQKTLFNHQKKLVDSFPKRHLLCWGTGTGKTLTSICLANKTGSKTLFITLKSLRTQWEVSLKEDCTVPYDVYTKEEFKKLWDILPFYNCIVIDEAHFFFGIKSQLSKSLEKYLNKWKPAHMYMLTATPYRSTPWDVYRMLQFFGRKINYYTFFMKFFYKVRMGMREVPMIRKDDKSKDDLIALLRSVGTMVRLEDCFDVPEQTYETIYVSLTKDQKKGFEKIDETLPMSRYIQMHQIIGGVTKGDEYKESETFETEKVDVLKEMLIDNPKAIVSCRYRAEIEMLKDIFEKEFPDKHIVLIHGDVEDRHGVLESCKGKESYLVLVAGQCSEGWELKDCPLVVFYSLDWQLKNLIQMQGRVQRAGSLKKNTYIYLVCKGTIDEMIYKTVVLDKADFHERIYVEVESE